ncbi:MAG TPA: protease pro-enzyme activation domain-containing protein [Terracidiphilus sp.]|nr:protease pro-enzyme activation domain-containing protein [Terracidiphilus sp.]
MKGSLHPFAQAQYQVGRMPTDTQLHGISIVFNRTPAQQADLKQLLADQQNPSSPLYHHWLTPQQFAARFGMAQSDIDKVQLWLQQQGFSIDSVSKSRNLIRFSGTSGQVEQAFQTQMNYYNLGGQKLFAASTALSLPVAFAATVANVGNLSNFRPRAQYVPINPRNVRAQFTSAQSGNVFFAPGDIKTAYNVNPLINAGNDGTGQTITIVGQSAVAITDITNFQNAAGLPNKAPTLLLMPGTGGSLAVAGDQGESDLDLEWSGAMAPGAKVYFVYTGSSQNYNVFDSIQYAVDNKIGNIISISYGACETGISSSTATALENVMSQGAAQGQSIISASGDQGSTSCSGITSYTIAQQQALSVNYPASSQYVTAVGGTEITSANDVSGNQYFTAANGTTDANPSVLKYIPEVAWNDDSSQYGLSSTGGGVSTLFPKPSWQTGVPGIPADSHRDVPDISFYSSPNNPGYLYCTGDKSDWSTSSSPVQTASCNSGFRDSSSQLLTVAGGTSFAAPIFAGILADINVSAGYTEGQGLVNPALYTLAANSAKYSAAFHDITAGGPSGTAGVGNQCLAGSTYCSSSSGGTTKYATTAGYDLATGLGSFDVAAIATIWPPMVAPKIGTSTTVAASNVAPTINTNDTFTITVTPVSGATAPTGSVTLIIDGGPSLGGSTTTATLTASGSSAVATYTTQFASTGAHSVIAQYGGNTLFASSTGGASVNIGSSSSGIGTFTLAGTNVSVTRGSQGSSTITVTPAGGYTGTVYLDFTTSNNSALTNLCYAFTNTLSSGQGSVSVTGASPTTTNLLFDTNAADCSSSSTGVGAQPGGRTFHRLGNLRSVAQNTRPSGPSRGPKPVPAGFALAGLLMAGFLGRRSRKLRALAMVLLLGSIGLGISACGGGVSGSSSISNPPTGTYTITLIGQDSTTASIAGSTTFTLTIQ